MGDETWDSWLIFAKCEPVSSYSLDVKISMLDVFSRRWIIYSFTLAFYFISVRHIRYRCVLSNQLQS
jgi:hypothetical protein